MMQLLKERGDNSLYVLSSRDTGLRWFGHRALRWFRQ